MTINSDNHNNDVPIKLRAKKLEINSHMWKEHIGYMLGHFYYENQPIRRENLARCVLNK